MKLLDQLKQFDYSHSSEPERARLELQSRFKDIASTMFYGGYIDVWDEFRVYIRAVEFYFHEENGCVKDDIVYHRKGGKAYSGTEPVPVFPTMSLHAHASGFDITFEKDGVRSSALIRKYALYDVKAGRFLDRGKGWEDDRSSYLYDYLNGFSLSSENRIAWKDEEIGMTRKVSEPMARVRTKAKSGDDRKWRFSAMEDIRSQVK